MEGPACGLICLETLWISPPSSVGAQVACLRLSHVWCRLNGILGCQGCYYPPNTVLRRLREEQWEICRGGQTTQKAEICLGYFWTSQPEQVLTFSLMICHWEVSSETQSSLRSSRYSSPHLAPRTASRQYIILHDTILYYTILYYTVLY